jgi:cell division protein FtsL
MNTAVRVIGQERFPSAISAFYPERAKVINVILIITLVLSAFAVIYIKDINRRLFIQYQGLQVAHDKSYQEWGKLLLEQSTWASQARIKKIAKQHLSMSTPASVIILKLSPHPIHPTLLAGEGRG